MLFRIYCKKNQRRCSKENGHRGPCNKDRKLHSFHKASPIHLNAKLKDLKEQNTSLIANIENNGKFCFCTALPRPRHVLYIYIGRVVFLSDKIIGIYTSLDIQAVFFLQSLMYSGPIPMILVSFL